MPPNGSGPTTYIGYKSSAPATAFGGLTSWGQLSVETLENVPALQWPDSVRTYHQMRNDSQVQGLYMGLTLPIRRMRWSLDPNGAEAGTVERVSRNYGLPILGEESEPGEQRSRNRFSFKDHLRHALLAMMYGHMFFQQVGEIDNRFGPEEWHMRKLMPMMPMTLGEVNVEEDGGLKSVRQLGTWVDTPPVPVNRLVAYVWDREGSNWIGRSMFRPLYRNWLIKDRLLRIDAINQERAGQGQPVAVGPPGATEDDLKALGRLATEVKAGEYAGQAIPYGSSLSFEGIRGSLPHTLESIRLHNEEMSRALLMMFMQLGQTETGSRALGSEFIEFFALALDEVAEWFAGVFNEHALWDDVDWNEGEDAPCPKVVHESLEPNLAIADLATLVEKGIVQVDRELEEHIRDRTRLPPKPEEEPEPEPPPQLEPEGPEQQTPPEPPQRSSPSGEPTTAGAVDRARRAAVAGVAASLPLPSRTLRRQPYDHEVRAAVNFQQMDEKWYSERDKLVSRVQRGQKTQIASLGDQIRGANGNLRKLAAIEAEPVHAATLTTASTTMMNTGAQQAMDEAKRQGKKRPVKPDLTKMDQAAIARAEVTDMLLANGLSDAARRKAIKLTGGALLPPAVAEQTIQHLNSLSSSYLEQELGGFLSAAMNAGRREAFKENAPQQIYASELLDSNTCENCQDIDGTEYGDLGEAEMDYPTGGYMDCLGGPRCRGTLVAVYEESESVEEGGEGEE